MSGSAGIFDNVTASTSSACISSSGFFFGGASGLVSAVWLVCVAGVTLTSPLWPKANRLHAKRNKSEQVLTCLPFMPILLCVHLQIRTTNAAGGSDGICGCKLQLTCISH